MSNLIPYNLNIVTVSDATAPYKFNIINLSNVTESDVIITGSDVIAPCKLSIIPEVTSLKVASPKVRVRLPWVHW